MPTVTDCLVHYGSNRHLQGTIGSLTHGITLHGKLFVLSLQVKTLQRDDAQQETEADHTSSCLCACIETGTTYDTEIEVLADGWILRVRNAYDAVTTLAIRSPGQAEEQIIKLEDDPFLTEFQCLVRSSLPADNNVIAADSVPRQPLSSFADALKTYKLSWKIRLAAEENAAQSA